MNEIDILSAFTVVNAVSTLGFVGGLAGLYHFQIRLDQRVSLTHTVPLLCVTAILGMLALGQWYSGPIAAVIFRGWIAALLIIIEIVLLGFSVDETDGV